MTEAEFDQWFSHHCAAFPSIGDWSGRLLDADATFTHWKRALANTTLAEALDVTDRMAIGDIEAPLEWEHRDQTAIVVRREASKQRGQRRKQSRDVNIRPLPSRHGGMFTPLRVLLNRVQTLGKSLRSGTLSQEDHDLQLEQVVHEAKKGGNDQRRVRCSDCNDAGLIICWHSFTVSAYRSTDNLQRSKWATMAVACSGCEAGRTHWLPEAEGGRENPTPRYDRHTHCRLVSECGLPNETDLAELRRWLAEDYLSSAMSGVFPDSSIGYV